MECNSKAPTFEFETFKERWELRNTRRENMVGGQVKKGSAAFSWADEVEKEEAEQARYHEQQKQKPNPFGSARPREVVLQEKGIDWRRLDFHLQKPSHSRQLDDPNLCKENIPASAAPGIDTIHSVTPSKCLKNEMEDVNSELKRSEIVRVPLATQNQIAVPFVPPLRYPPKNVMPSLSESGFHYYLHELDKARKGFHSKRPPKPEKENIFHQQGLHRDPCSQNLNHGSSICPHHHRQIWQGRHLKENRINFKLGQSVGTGKNLKKSAASRIQQVSDSATEIPCKNLQEDYAVNQGVRQSLTNHSYAGGTNIKQKNGLERSVAKRSSGTKLNVILNRSEKGMEPETSISKKWRQDDGN